MGKIVDISEALLAANLTSSATSNERALLLMCIRFAEGAIKRHLKYDPIRQERTEYYPRYQSNVGNPVMAWEANDTVAYNREISAANGNQLIMSHVPIRSIASLRVDYDGRFGQRSGSFGSETLKTLGTDYWLTGDRVDSDGNLVCTDGIIRSVGLWPSNPGSIKVVYTAGYSNDELHGQDSLIDASPIWEACLDETIRRVQRAFAKGKKSLAGFSGPLTSENLGDYSYTADGALLQQLVGGGDISSQNVEKLNDFQHYGLMI